MKSSNASSLLISSLLFLLAIFLLSGCETGIPSGPPSSDPELTVWLGSYSSSEDDDSGAFMIDIYRVGNAVSAELVIRSREEENPYDHLFLNGSARGNDIDLELNTDLINYGFSFDLELTMSSDGTMSGSFYYSTYDMTADVACVELEGAAAEADTSFDMSFVSLGLAYDSTDVWISTSTRDHILMDPATTAFIDTVVVFIAEEARWTSEALTSDGTVLYGGYPITVSGPEGSRSESDIIEFEKDGDFVRRFRIGHRTSGLAWSGEDLWSLPIESDYFYRVGLDGTVLESVPASVPDLVDIEFDGTDFWAIGWFMKRLYRIDSAGEVLSVYSLPLEYGYVFPAALTFDGTNLWYCTNTSYLDSRLYRLNLE